MTPFYKIYYLSVALICTSSTMPHPHLQENSVIRFLALGDSYTIGESVPEDDRWPMQLTGALRNRGIQSPNPDIIATTGWRTDELEAAILRKNPPKNYNLVSLLIGVNNQYQGRSAGEYSADFGRLLDLAIAHAKGEKAHVFVVSIPDYGFTPFGQQKQPEISTGIDLFNSINRRIAREKGVTYVDITDISRRGLDEPELVASDGLHPSGKMYALWVERILDALDR